MSLLQRLFGNSKKTENQAGKAKEESLQAKQTGAQPRPSSGSEMDMAIATLQGAGSWERKRDAATVLSKYSGDRTFKALVNAMKNDNNWVVRFTAADSLAGFGEEAVEPLIAALGDQQATVVEHAAQSLGKIKSERAIDPLIKTLSYTGDYSPVRAAREALVAYGPDIVPKLLSLIGDAGIHPYIIEALADISDLQAAEALLAVAKDTTDKTYIRALSVWGLGNISGFDCSSALLEILSETNDTKLVDALVKTLNKLLPGVDIQSAARDAKKRGLEKYLANLRSIVPGISEEEAQSLSGAYSYFQSGANMVCKTKFGDFQVVVGSEKRVINTLMLENVLKEVESALQSID